VKIKKSRKLAIRWYERAAEQGSNPARDALVRLGAKPP